MGYEVRGKGQGVLRPDVDLKQLNRKLHYAGFSVHDMDVPNVHISMEGKWGPDWIGNSRLIFTENFISLEMEFIGEDFVSWRWCVSEGKLVEQLLKKVDDGDPTIYP